MSTSNYPAGVTQGQITSLCGSDDYIPNTEDCILCGLLMRQDEDTRRWYPEEDACMGMHYCLTFCDALDVIETQVGLVCSRDCMDEKCHEGKVVEPEQQTKLHLVAKVVA